MTDAQFSVDTALFRQLGELLVGRDSTALVELVKNAYDADATRVVLEGRDLQSSEHGTIRIIDDGVGMTATQFTRGFLRLAARNKASGDRRSPIFRRHFTGEKGVGRLAAHKLGSLITVTSVASEKNGQPAASYYRDRRPEASADELKQLNAAEKTTLVRAVLDWDLIEESDSLSTIERGLTVEVASSLNAARKGTDLSISRLRHPWDSRDLQELSRQLKNFAPPEPLMTKMPRYVLTEALLFERARVRDTERDDPGMHLDLQGEFASPEEYWTQVERNADWVLEISVRRGQQVQVHVAPTRAGLEANPFSKALRVEFSHPAPNSGPFFDARVFLRSGTVPLNERAWAQSNSGIRVYLEGFRVLPYGEVGNDWLALDQDYTRRSGRVDIDPLLGGPGDSLADLQALSARDVSLRLQPNRNFFGAVFLTDNDSGGLRTLVNREGFVPDETYERLVSIIRSGTNLLHRSWARASLDLKRERNAELHRFRESIVTTGSQPNEVDTSHLDPESSVARREDPSNRIVIAPTLEEESISGTDVSELQLDGRHQGSAASLLQSLAELRRSVSLIDPAQNHQPYQARTLELLAGAEYAAGRLIEDASLLRVLASVGAQLSVVTHELANIAPLAMEAELSLRPKEGERWPPRITEVRQVVVELRRAIERQVNLLANTATNEARRRRSRLDLAERVDVIFLAFASAAAKAEVSLRNLVKQNTRTPPLFRSELQAILSNLISNALKASPNGGVVAVFASETIDHLAVTVENQGTPVEIETSEQWFQPFASTSTSSDPVLGQGMGLGLSITRDFVNEYGGSVRFVKPQDGFDTAIEFRIPR